MRSRPTSIVCVITTVGLALASVVPAIAPSLAGSDSGPAEIAFREQPGRLEITLGGEPLATYVWRDDAIRRPYFAHLRAPGGVQVTRNHPPVEGTDRTDHAGMHPGLWLAFGSLGGGDFWRNRDCCRVEHMGFVETPRGGAGEGTFTARNRYVVDERTVCVETCRVDIRSLPEGMLLAVDAVLAAAGEDFDLGDQQEMGLGVRVATPIAVVAGGRLLDSEGRRGEREIWGLEADWCDASGVVDGREGGVALMAHPENFRRSRMHARDYGCLVVNPFGRRDFGKGEESRVTVRAGESLRLRFGALLHAHAPGGTVDIEAAYRAYVALASTTPGDRGEAFESFRRDPRWEGRNNAPPPSACVERRQDFGYSATAHAGGERGEIGGVVSRSLTPASYARVIPRRTLENRLRASGRFAVMHAEGGSGVLIGWFSSRSRGWRTPNSLVFRIDGEANAFRVFFEYGTRTWRTGGGQTFEGEYQTNPKSLRPADGAPHEWALEYDPASAGGRGEIAFSLDGETFRAALGAEPRLDARGEPTGGEVPHREEGAVFDRFGILNQMSSGDLLEVWLDDIVLDGEAEDFARDPGWESNGSRRTFRDCAVRPYHDFGWRDTARAGGEPGEVGGLVWRIEDDQPGRALAYGRPVGPLGLDRPLRASGRLAMLAAAADSAILVGWYSSEAPPGAPPLGFAGVLIEGPSRAGHYFRPAWGLAGGGAGVADRGPVLRPDGASHEWTIEYTPAAAGDASARGRITATLDGRAATLEIGAAAPAAEGADAAQTVLDRFGFLSWHRGGHFVEIYFDDLSFTAR